MSSASSSGQPASSGGYAAGSNSKAASGSSGVRRPSEAEAEKAEQQVSSSSANGDSATGRQATNAGAVSSAAGAPSGQQLATASGSPSTGPTGGATVPMGNYDFFVKYTYSNECALLAYNFNEMVTQLGLFEYFTYRHDHRLISVTLAYIFYRYQVHHCDMALDLAVTLVYLEDVRAAYQPELHEHNKDAFNLICYLAFLAHAFNADRTIRLSDWYKEIGWRSFRNCQQLNGYVFFLFSQVRRFRLRVSETRVKRYIRKLCSVPSQMHSES